MSLVAPNQLLSSHSGVVLCTAFSPDGTQLVSGSSDTTLKIWNAATGKEHRTFMGHSCPVITACWSRDGQLIASGDDGTASAPAGRGAAAVGDDDAASFRGAIIIWDVSSGRALKCLQLPERRNFSGAYSCSFSPASSELVVGCDDHLVVFCCSSWRVIHVMSGVHSGPVLSLAYSSSSPQGPPLIAAGDWAGNLSVWSSSSGRCLRVARAHTQRVRCVAFSPDDVFLASASDDCSVRLWRVATLQLVVILNGHFDWVSQHPSAAFPHPAHQLFRSPPAFISAATAAAWWRSRACRHAMHPTPTPHSSSHSTERPVPPPPAPGALRRVHSERRRAHHRLGRHHGARRDGGGRGMTSALLSAHGATKSESFCAVVKRL